MNIRHALFLLGEVAACRPEKVFYHNLGEKAITETLPAVSSDDSLVGNRADQLKVDSTPPSGLPDSVLIHRGSTCALN